MNLAEIIEDLIPIICFSGPSIAVVCYGKYLDNDEESKKYYNIAISSMVISLYLIGTLMILHSIIA